MLSAHPEGCMIAFSGMLGTIEYQIRAGKAENTCYFGCCATGPEVPVRAGCRTSSRIFTDFNLI